MAPCAVAWWLAGLGLIRIRSTSTHRCARRNIIFRYLFDGIPCLNFDDRFGGLALDFFFAVVAAASGNPRPAVLRDALDERKIRPNRKKGKSKCLAGSRVTTGLCMHLRREGREDRR